MSNNIKEINNLLQEREVRKSRLLTQKKEYEAETKKYKEQQQQALDILKETKTLLDALRADFSEQEDFGQLGAEDRSLMMAEVEERLREKIRAAEKDKDQYTELLLAVTQQISRIERKLLQIERSCFRLKEMLKKFSTFLSPGIFSSTLKDRIKRTQEFQEAIQLERQEALQWERQAAMEQVFICSITQAEMEDPVVLERDGYSYDRAAIETWLAQNQTSPLTGLPLDNKNIWVNHALKQVISAVCANQPFHSFFLCPLTGLPMKDPVILADGHSYERAAIQNSLKENAISPVTKELLSTKEIFPNHTLKSVIEAAPEYAILEKAAPPLKKVYASNESVRQVIRSLM